MNPSKKVFPIHNESACVFKWGWNTFRLYSGKSSSCHRVDPVFVPVENFENFHNTNEVIQDRQLMLNGLWPTGRGCEYCKNIEDVGGISDRVYHNNIPGLTPIDFTTDEIQVTPRIQEIYLNNTCDLACVYCSPTFSSKINDELKKFGPLSAIKITPLDRSPMHDVYLSKMLSWLETHSKNLQRLSIQGGEPFLQKEFNQLIEFLEKNSNPDLELSVNTNLNSKFDNFNTYILRIKELLIKKKIKRFDINCSIDCWGPRQEYIRYGLNLENWRKNFEMLIENRWIYINVQHTITSLSIGTMAELQTIINQYLTVNPKINQSFQIVDGFNQELYHPSIFGGSFFQDQLNTVLQLIPEGSEQQKLSKERMNSIVNMINQGQIDVDRLNKLKTTLDEYTVRRNSNWEQLFPEIEKYFIDNRIGNVV